MANNKVQLADGTVLIDLTGDNIQPENVEEGITFHDASGTQRSGTLQRGAQVASGSVTLSKKNQMNINPGFAVRNVCFALPKSSSTSDAYRGGGIYIDGTASGDITSVDNVHVSDQYSTSITFNHPISGTVYWLATS